jgi:death-on-curing protein
MKYLTTEQVLFIHSRIIHETGGSHGVRDLGLLESAVARPQATFDGVELHGDLFQKTAALFHALLKNHPFVDGNKRTAVTAAGMFIQANGCFLSASNKEIEVFTLKATNSEVEFDKIADWFRIHSDE